MSIKFHGFSVDGGVIEKPAGGSSTPIETMASSFSSGALPPPPTVMDPAAPSVVSSPLSPLLGVGIALGIAATAAMGGGAEQFNSIPAHTAPQIGAPPHCG